MLLYSWAVLFCALTNLSSEYCISQGDQLSSASDIPTGAGAFEQAQCQLGALPDVDVIPRGKMHLWWLNKIIIITSIL